MPASIAGCELSFLHTEPRQADLNLHAISSIPAQLCRQLRAAASSAPGLSRVAGRAEGLRAGQIRSYLSYASSQASRVTSQKGEQSRRASQEKCTRIEWCRHST